MADEREQDRLRKGRDWDSNTLIAIYDDYHEPLYRYVYRQVHDVEIARDLVADLFGRLLQAIQRGRGPDRSAKAWLYRAAHNAVVDHYRAQQVRQHLPLDERMTATGNDPARIAEKQLAAESVRCTLLQLTRDQQQVIALKFLAGFDNQEVAEILDKPIGAVKSLQHRALAGLRRRLLPAEEKAT
jgi:RNA polymerase sigma-70 factor (ECF subfamily)